MIDIEDLVENCWQREIRFLSRCFRKLFSAFTFSLDKNNIGCPPGYVPLDINRILKVRPQWFPFMVSPQKKTAGSATNQPFPSILNRD
jgi:hypothetical protein